jgi:hypothetical protein
LEESIGEGTVAHTDHPEIQVNHIGRTLQTSKTGCTTHYSKSLDSDLIAIEATDRMVIDARPIGRPNAVRQLRGRTKDLDLQLNFVGSQIMQEYQDTSPALVPGRALN